jgi:hypothetical protein
MLILSTLKSTQTFSVDRLALLIPIREVQGTNLGPYTGYLDVFVDVIQFLNANTGTVP